MSSSNTSNASDPKRKRVDGGEQFNANAEFYRLLIGTGVEQLGLEGFPDGRLYIVRRSDRLKDVFQGLVKHHFLSVPVLKKKGTKYYGFLDISDIVHYIVRHFGRKKLVNLDNFWEMVREEESFQDKMVSDVITYPISRKNPFHPVTKGYSLFSAVELMAREPSLRRVAVLDNNGNLLSIITQSQVVNFIYKNISVVGNKRNKPVSSLKNVIKEVYSIYETQEAIKAFELMSEKNVSGVAVINEAGKIVETLSVSDLKTMGSDARLFWRLYQTTAEFIKKTREINLANSENKTAHHLVTVKSTDTVEQVIKSVSENKIHRVFIVDDNGIAIGVVSMRDILLELITVE